MSKMARVEIPLYLMHETDPKSLHSAILAKLEVLEELEYEIAGVDNILLQQTDTIRSAKPASADAYAPKIEALEDEVRRLKQQERQAMDKQRSVNAQIEQLRVVDEKIEQAAQEAVEEHLAQLANRMSKRGVTNGKCAVSAQTRAEYELFGLYEKFETQPSDLSGVIEQLKDAFKGLEKQQSETQQSYYNAEDKQVKLLAKLRRIASAYESDIDSIKVDIVREENFVNLYQSKIKDLEFKQLVESNKLARRQAQTAAQAVVEEATE